MKELEAIYRQRYESALVPLARAIKTQLSSYLAGEPRIDRVSTRAKSIDRFLQKAQTCVNDEPKYAEPFRQIQDQIGARIITFYRSDIPRVSDIVMKYYRPIESQDIVPDSEWEFGYFGTHFVLFVPVDLIDPELDKGLIPEFFELQIKTLFQHAWSEANHDLGYKPAVASLTSDAKRRLAFTSAQAWGADQIFDELFRGQSGVAEK